ncbi:insulinase family protein [Permianibacter sp. IMCC34836]|uniref:M16 family metallopeptidase n=1 Tax=Permianibacter fluminis TaxID=2738515 RepID=UPI0015534F43|nr:pitrilysin family protein [Permianibacter fluminis]NQD36844.1 insulinase family protein [Permianibacter fluminis]
MTPIRLVTVAALLLATAAAGDDRTGDNTDAVANAVNRAVNSPNNGTNTEPANCPAVAYALQQLGALDARRSQFQLDNGLTVILLPDAEASTVAVVTTVQVGARDEQDGETGYAHLFEHLMFKGSDGVPDGAYSQRVNGVGGSFNAETDFDRTSYYVTAPAEALEQLLWLEAERFRAPDLSAEKVHNQIAAVREEMALTVDNVPFMRSGSELLFTQLQGSDYDHLVLGSVADLDAATAEKLQAFYQRHYRPERAVLVLAGRFDAAVARQWLQRDWSRWHAHGDAAAITPLQRPLARAFDATLVDSRAPWPALLLAWQTVPDDHPDAAAVALVYEQMLRGEQGQLRQRLLAKQWLLHSAELPLQLPRLGLAHFIAVPRAAAALTDLETEVRAAFTELAQQAPSEQQLCELKTARLRRLIGVAEGPLMLGYRESIDQALWQQSRLLAEVSGLQQVTSADMSRVTAQYFLRNQLTLTLSPPWYLRWAKRVLEWLPVSWSEALEAKAL